MKFVLHMQRAIDFAENIMCLVLSFAIYTLDYNFYILYALLSQEFKFSR